VRRLLLTVVLCFAAPAFAQVGDESHVLEDANREAAERESEAADEDAEREADEAADEAAERDADEAADEDTDEADAEAPDDPPQATTTDVPAESGEAILEDGGDVLERVEDVADSGASEERPVTSSSEPEGPPSFGGAIHGEYRFRLNLLSDIPLDTQSRTGIAPELGQNVFGMQWLRLSATLELQHLKLLAQIDVADGLILGDHAEGVGSARATRDGVTAFEPAGLDPRWLYLDWTTSIGVIRAGLQPSHWGLGILANDGTRAPPFGDYRYGNRSIRLLYATRPGGADHPFLLAFAGDLVYEDMVADITRGERALQAVVAGGYQQGERALAAYVVFRDQRGPSDPNGVYEGSDDLRVVGLDLFFQWDFAEPTGGRLRLAFEGVHLRGTTTTARGYDRPEEQVRQWMWAAQVARVGDTVDATLEAGWTSGDSNTEDGVQRRATMHPDHRVGLILFPEVLAWHTARASQLAGDAELVGRAAPGSELLPSDGGVFGAAYLFNHYAFRPKEWLDLRIGWVWARATSDVVNPYRQRAESRAQSWLGGPAENRDLGFELDAAVLFHLSLPYEIQATLGLDGGVFVPGRAFDDAAGNPMDPVAMVRARVGLAF